MKSSSVLVRVRVNRQLKQDAAAVLQKMGLTVSDALRIMLTRIALEKKLPFDLYIPNEKTAAAMRESDCKKLESFKTVDELMLDLNSKP
jgi:DNA-damage-inducible protein J